MPIHELTEAQSRTLASKPYATETVSFTHTLPTQFAHFEGSEAGAATTFGMKATDLAKLVNKMVDALQDQYKEYNVPEIKDALRKLAELKALVSEKIKELQDKKRKEMFSNSARIHRNGHIPLIMSKLTAAAVYKEAVRKIDADQVEFYISHVPGSAAQIKEFIIKNEIMAAVAEFRDEIVTARYLLAEHGGGAAFYFYNDVILRIDDKVINPNQHSMPHSEQFDLLVSFVEKIYDLLCQIPDQDEYKQLRKNIFTALRSSINGNPYALQEKLSSKLYDILVPFVKKLVTTDDDGDVTFSDNADELLQFILPIVAYLNSPSNPFALDGLYGKQVLSDFHTRALAAYKKHEAKVTTIDRTPILRKILQNEIADKPFAHPEFTDDQMLQLIFGNEDDEPAAESRSIFASIGRGLMGAIGDADTSVQARSGNLSRAQVLTLSNSESYLAIEPPRPDTAPRQ